MSLAAKAQKKEEDGEMRNFPCFVVVFVYVGAIAAIAGAIAAALLGT